MLHYAYMCDVHIRDDIMRRKQQSVSNGEGTRFLVDNPHKNKDDEKLSGDGWFGTMWCSCDIIVMLELWFQPNKNSNSWWPVTIVAPLNRQSLYCYVVGFVIVAPQWHGPIIVSRHALKPARNTQQCEPTKVTSECDVFINILPDVISKSDLFKYAIY